MHSVGDSEAADRHWRVDPPTARCMLLGLGGRHGDTGADNVVVFGDGNEPVVVREQVDARVLVES